jgi:hypothetical protein
VLTANRALTEDNDDGSEAKLRSIIFNNSVRTAKKTAIHHYKDQVINAVTEMIADCGYNRANPTPNQCRFNDC